MLDESILGAQNLCKINFSKIKNSLRPRENHEYTAQNSISSNRTFGILTTTFLCQNLITLYYKIIFLNCILKSAFMKGRISTAKIFLCKI